MTDVLPGVVVKRILLGMAMIAMATTTAQVEATTLSPLTQDQKADAADLIVRGTVTEVWTAKDDIGRVWTHAQIEVSQTFKGQPVDGVLVSQMGGVVANDFQPMHGAPRFSVGEEGYFFLENLEAGYTGVVGWMQGKYTVRIDPLTGDEMLVQLVLSQDTWYDHRFIPHPPEDERVMVDDFEQELKANVANGWDGQPIPGVSAEKLERINPYTPEVVR